MIRLGGEDARPMSFYEERIYNLAQAQAAIGMIRHATREILTCLLAETDAAAIAAVQDVVAAIRRLDTKVEHQRAAHLRTWNTP